MQSEAYSDLVQSIEILRGGLIDFPEKEVTPHSDTYSKGELLRCQSFVVFSHAEMQVYWETIARKILSEAENLWKNESIIGCVIGTLIAFRSPEKAVVPNNPKEPNDSENFDKIIAKAIKNHRNFIENNNGIKRSNISTLLTPIGIFSDYLEENMLIQLDQTGKRRGDIVHKASKVSLQNIRDPFLDEMKEIDDLVKEIGKFDSMLIDRNLVSVK